MPKRLKLRELQAILSHFEVSADSSRGKGSHTLYSRMFEGKSYSYAIPNNKDVLPCYVKGVRRKLHLLPEDGVSDEEFYR